VPIVRGFVEKVTLGRYYLVPADFHMWGAANEHGALNRVDCVVPYLLFRRYDVFPGLTGKFQRYYSKE
jgi:hypothetical protein